jgi:hypothetical protein
VNIGVEIMGPALDANPMTGALDNVGCAWRASFLSYLQENHGVKLRQCFIREAFGGSKTCILCFVWFGDGGSLKDGPT